MQDQLTANQSNLQEPRTDLQQTTPNLQQSGTPTGTANSSSLNQTPSNIPLRVQTQTGQGSIQPVNLTPPSTGPSGWLLVLLIVAVAVIATVLGSKTTAPVEEPAEEPPAPVVPKPSSKPNPKKKKSAKRKKSSKR